MSQVTKERREGGDWWLARSPIRQSRLNAALGAGTVVLGSLLVSLAIVGSVVWDWEGIWSAVLLEFGAAVFLPFFLFLLERRFIRTISVRADELEHRIGEGYLEVGAPEVWLDDIVESRPPSGLAGRAAVSLGDGSRWVWTGMSWSVVDPPGTHPHEVWQHDVVEPLVKLATGWIGMVSLMRMRSPRYSHLPVAIDRHSLMRPESSPPPWMTELGGYPRYCDALLPHGSRRSCYVASPPLLEHVAVQITRRPEQYRAAPTALDPATSI